MQGDPAFIGQYAGRGKGNFRFKAALESLGNLIHNEMADVLQLPGQTGRNTDGRPEETHGLLRHNDALLNALTALHETRPEIAQLLRFPVVSLTQFREIADAIYSRINARTDHRLEGWDMLCVPADGGRSVRRLSPVEVWDAGRRALVPMRPEAIAQVLYRDCADEVRVTDRREIEVMDKHLAADVIRFNAASLPAGERYQSVLNPFAPQHLYLFDSRGRYVGQVPRMNRVDRADPEAVKREMGRARHELAELLKPVAILGARITKQRIEETRANAAALAPEHTPDSRLSTRAAAAGAAIRSAQTETDPEVGEVEEISSPTGAPMEDGIDEVIDHR
jgi:hypothetical protein